MRTTPLAQWSGEAVVFDARVRRAAESILGVPFSDQAYTQAALTPALGGLGLRRVVDHADGAFSASWRESQSTAGEVWSPPPQVSAYVGSQRESSLKVDTVIHQRLVDSSVSPRERQRLLRVTELTRDFHHGGSLKGGWLRLCHVTGGVSYLSPLPSRGSPGVWWCSLFFLHANFRLLR